jgi:photosystem II stability/assembly factor-like uncharacterized protein
MHSTLRSPILALAFCAAFSVPGLAADEIPESAYQDVHWRLVGPLRGGWATAATGVPGRPNTFYFGAADGGVWKSTDAGRTWTPSFQDESVASIGALVVAPSDPDVLYAGTGQVSTRWDIPVGDGVYRSSDGGESWESCGLVESEHIGRLWVDPRDAQVVLAAALGHLYGPNTERGVFRSEDGGRTWSRVLFVDDDTGAVDLAGDPSAPDVLFAATWQARRWPWQAYFTPITGPGSGIHRSSDGGRTWTRLVGNGLPDVDVGRIGLAVAPGSGGARVYATIDAGEQGGLFRSDDSGAHWTRVNDDTGLANDYFAALTVDPRDPDWLHVMGRSIRTSTDGGVTLSYTRGSPGGDDYHFLWIDPQHPERRIAGADQGAVVTVNDGESWSSWYNQPTGQFYRVAVDDRSPYWIYSGQQDSGTVALASRSDYGQLTFRDWHPVGADERDYDIPFPGDPEIVYGSGLGGKLSRWDARTGQVRIVSPWPVSSYGQRPTSVRYRTTWLTPLAISPHAPHAIYQAAQVLFRSLDGGESWEVVSPDLTGAQAEPGDCEGDVPVERATACGYGVIFSIGLSPLSADLVWLGTDNGRVWLSRNACSSWEEVTPPGVGDWSKIASVDPSPTYPATAYLAVDRHRLDDFTPHVWVTHDFGATWSEASAGLPARTWVNVVRQDPARPGLLYAGTNRGVFVSFDDGGRWQPLQHDLPTTGVNDLKVHEDDLVIATLGRGIWALDNVSPLRELNPELAGAEVVLLPPARAQRLSPNQNRDTPLPVDEPRAENPPVGAVIDYLFASEPSGPVVLEIVDAGGQLVRSFRSDEAPPRPEAEAYFPENWMLPPAPLPARAGHNRFVWNLRTDRPRTLEYEYSIAAVPGADTPALPQGIFALPGRYTLRLSSGGKALEQPLDIDIDPRVHVSRETLVEQFEFYREVVDSLERATDARLELREVGERLEELAREAEAGRESSDSAERGRALAEELTAFEGGGGDEDIAAIAGVLGSLATDVESADGPPTEPQREVQTTYTERLDAAITRLQALRDGPE